MRTTIKKSMHDRLYRELFLGSIERIENLKRLAAGNWIFRFIPVHLKEIKNDKYTKKEN